MLYQPISQWHSLHFELLIELIAQKLTELWRFKNLAYFWTWWPSSMTYLFVNVTYWNCSPIPYVDQVWWWYVKAFMSYAWQNGQTNRQTDKRTYLQKLKILASNKHSNSVWSWMPYLSYNSHNHINVKNQKVLGRPRLWQMKEQSTFDECKTDAYHSSLMYGSVDTVGYHCNAFQYNTISYTPRQ